jgi:hypothetical protein
MALASNPAASTESSIIQIDAYLLDIYQQAAETSRPGAAARIVSLGWFLGFAGLMTTALAVLFNLADGSSGPSIGGSALVLGVLGLVVSVTFHVLEARRQESVQRLPTVVHTSDAASSLYLAAIGFFTFTIVIAAALLLLR